MGQSGIWMLESASKGTSFSLIAIVGYVHECKDSTLWSCSCYLRGVICPGTQPALQQLEGVPTQMTSVTEMSRTCDAAT